MRVRYDREADALYLRLADDAVLESEKVRPGMVVDFDGKGRIVGIELLSARESMSPEALAGIEAA